jgi:PIN like domain
VPEALRADGWDLITLAEHYGMPADEQVPDTEWIEEAAKRGWLILMKDKRIRRRQAEIAAVAEHKARCFVITRGDLPSADMVQRFIANTILMAAAQPGAYIYSVQTDRISPLPIAPCLPDFRLPAVRTYLRRGRRPVPTAPTRWRQAPPAAGHRLPEVLVVGEPVEPAPG